MATTIISGFQKLRENLEITFLQASTVSTRQTNVRDAIRGELTVLDDFLTGSYMRNTMVSPLAEADVDIFVVLSSEYYSEDGQGSLLDRVKRVLRKTYPSTPDISRDGQAVTISFSDFKVDVVPAFNRLGGGYLIADTGAGQWLSTNPKAHVQIWSDRNKTHVGDLVPIIKMLKGWNKTHGGYLRSFYLEVLILQIFNGVTISNFPSAIRFFFDRARTIAGYALSDPGGYSQIRGLSEADRTEVMSRMETAYSRAVNAEEEEKLGKTSDAFYYWRLIFDDYFPAYG
jgi:hypothetical protein